MAIVLMIVVIIGLIGIGMSTYAHTKDNQLSEQYRLRRISDGEHWGGIILGILIVGGAAAFAYLSH